MCKYTDICHEEVPQIHISIRKERQNSDTLPVNLGYLFVTHMCIYAHIYTYIYVYIYTHIYTYSEWQNS